VSLNPQTKFTLDLLPLAVFFAGYKWLGLYAATALLMGVTVVVIAIIYLFERKIALAPLITAIVVGIFGGLTLWFHNDTFIKIKPTLVNLTFAGILLTGCYYKKGLLKPVLGLAFDLTERGWWLLSRRWGFFFLAMAMLNELVWRNVSTDLWVDFKVFGLIGLTFVFAVLQLGFIQKHLANS